MAECPDCGTNVKAAPGKLAVCPKCETKFRAPAEASRPASKKAVAKKAADPPAEEADMYGFDDHEDLAELRRKREEKEKLRAEEKKKEEKPVIEIRRKNIGDLAVWAKVDKAMVWFLIGVCIWGAAHLVFGLILFLGMVQGPEYAGPVVTKLIRNDQPPIEIGEGDSLDRPAFVIAMLGGLDLSTFTLVLLIFIQLLGWARAGVWVAGYAIAYPAAPVEMGGKGQIKALYTFAGLNFLFAFFFVFLPFVGAYSYCIVPWTGSEMAMATTNMERTVPLHVFWAFAPFWETLLAFVIQTLFYLEPIMIAYFTWTVACTIKDEPLERESLGAVGMGFAVMFLMLSYQLVALAGTSPPLVQVLRVLYCLWYAAAIVWMLRLVGMVLKCRETFRFYFHPDED